MRFEFSNEGAVIRFNNGATISIRTGPDFYCEPGESCEVHAWGPDMEPINFSKGDNRQGWVSPNKLPFIMTRVKNWRKEK